MRGRFARRYAGAPVLVTILGLLAAACRPSEPPNLVLVVLDTARADAVGFAAEAGGPLGDMARGGTVYTEARAHSSWTLPNHASLFSGLLPSQHGAHQEHQLLAHDVATLAELLPPAYVSAGFSENPHVGAAKGLARGFQHFEETWRERPPSREIPPSTLERVRAWLALRPLDRPFFLFVNLMDAHLPYRPRESALREVAGSEPAAERARRMWSFQERDAVRFIAGRAPLKADEMQDLRLLYTADVRGAEARAAALVVELARQGVLEQTLLVITSDHGESLGEHGLWQHQFSLYETLLRIPLLLHWPERIAGGRRSAAPVQLVDVTATLLDAAGVPPARWPGAAPHSLLRGDPPEGRAAVAELMRPIAARPVYARLVPDFEFDRLDRRLRSVRQGRWKLIVEQGAAPRLFDLDEDPGETRDRSAELPDVVARLRAELARSLPAWSALATDASDAVAPPLDAATRDALEALGYGR